MHCLLRHNSVQALNLRVPLVSHHSLCARAQLRPCGLTPIRTLELTRLRAFGRACSSAQPHYLGGQFCQGTPSAVKSANYTNSCRRVARCSSSLARSMSVEGAGLGEPRSGGLASQLWRGSSKHALQSLYSPFVVALAQGTLPRESFQHYVQQDVFFLNHFALAYQLCLDKASNLPESVQARLRHLLQGVAEEKKLHAQYARQWGVDISVPCKPNKACKAYTDFLVSVASSAKSVDLVLAAMVPCSRLYGWLGCQLAAAYGADESSPYADWIKTYSSTDYLALPTLKEELLEELAVNTPIEELQDLYSRAMLLELDFFCAQPHTPPPRQVRVFVTDFDDTLTTKDTSPNTYNTAVQRAAEAQATDEVSREALLKSKRDLVSSLEHNYFSKYAALLDSLLPKEGGASCDLHSFYQALMEFDTVMNKVVVDSGIVQGLRVEDIHEVSRGIPMWEGCLDVLSRIHSAQIPVYVVSLNWSQEVIKTALKGLPCRHADRSEASVSNHSTASIGIHANDLVLGSDGVTTGAFIDRVTCGLHKLQLLQSKILPDHQASTGCSVYVGDSASDLPALLAADVGIVVGKSSSLRRVLNAYGIQLKPLCTAPVVAVPRSPEDWHSGQVVYEAPDWSHIGAFLFNHSHHEPSSALNSEASAQSATTYIPPASSTSPAATITPPSSITPAGRIIPPNGAQSRAFTHSAAQGPPAACPKVPRVLSIAGSDSGGGAGIQADLKAFISRGVFGMSALTALTAQNTHGVHGVNKPPLDFVEQQIDCVLGDIGADVVKTGMLPDGPTVSLVARKVRQYSVPLLVVDPVITSTSGHVLAEDGVAYTMTKELFPLATIVTPNIPEASALLGGMQIKTLDDMKEAARQLHQMGMRYVLLKGGHLAGSWEEAGGEAVDILFDGQNMRELRAPYVTTTNTHGTGCTLASSIAAELAKGAAVEAAVAEAKQYLTDALQHSAELGIGTGVQRPFNPGFAIADWAAEAAKTRMDLRVYAVTDTNCNTKTNRSMVEAVEAACMGGATILQLREKDTEGGDFLALAKAVLQVTRRYGVPLIINDRVDVALAAGADGVHVGQSDLPAAEVRRLLGPRRLVGVSVKSVEQARDAQEAGADYLGAGAVFPTSTKDSSVMGLEVLSEICSAVSIPIVAIGGITQNNAGDSVLAGCAGVAVVSNIFAAQDPVAATQELARAVDSALEERAKTQK